MTDLRAKMVADLMALHGKHFGTEAEAALAKKLAAEKAASQADMSWHLANITMPPDIRERARAWGMEAFCEVLWNAGFQAGWRECSRAQKIEAADA